MKDYTARTRSKLILQSAAPHMLLMLSQSLIAIVDTLIVAHIGIEAIAAVGISGFIFAVMTSGLVGIMISVQSVVGRAMGERNVLQAIGALQAAIIISIVGGLVLITLIAAVPFIVGYLTTDPILTNFSIEYLSIMLLAAPAIGIVRAFRGYLAGLQYNFVSLLIVLIIYAFNIVISVILVNNGYGIRGAAIGTTASFFIGAILCFATNYIVDSEYRFFKIAPIKPVFRVVLTQTYYSGLQQFFFSAVFVSVFAIAGRISSESLAIVTVLNNALVFVITPMIGLGLASTTFVGMAIGAREGDKAMQWGNTAFMMGMVLYALQLVFIFFPADILKIFLDEAALAEKYKHLLQITILLVIFEPFAQILKFSLFGAGKSKEVAKITILLQWVFFIPSAYFFCLVQGHGVETLWLMFLGYRGVEASFIALMWFSRKWFVRPGISQSQIL